MEAPDLRTILRDSVLEIRGEDGKVVDRRRDAKDRPSLVERLYHLAELKN